MLFYQKISDQNSPVLPKKSRVSIMRQEAEDLTLLVLQLFDHQIRCLFICFYTKLLCLPRSAPSSPDVSPQSSPRPPRANNDRLTLLTRLVRKGEKKGLFVEKMPASIYQVT